MFWSSECIIYSAGVFCLHMEEFGLTSFCRLKRDYINITKSIILKKISLIHFLHPLYPELRNKQVKKINEWMNEKKYITKTLTRPASFQDGGYRVCFHTPHKSACYVALPPSILKADSWTLGYQWSRKILLGTDMKLYDSCSTEASRMPKAVMKNNTGIKQPRLSLIF